MKKCKDCKYFGDPVYKVVEDCDGKIKDPESHICNNAVKSGYNYCKYNAYACPAFETAILRSKISPVDALDITYNSMQDHLDKVSELVNQIRKYQEKELAWIITHYDFIVGSIECAHKLMEILPDGANIICSMYVEDPNIIYAVKKFDIKDLINLEDGVLNFGDQDTLMPAT